MWLEPKPSGLSDFSLESIRASASSQGRDVSIRNRGLNVRSDMWLMVGLKIVNSPLRWKISGLLIRFFHLLPQFFKVDFSLVFF